MSATLQMDRLSADSTVRVARYRKRQAEAGRKRITLYLDPETLHMVIQLAGDRAQAAFLEKIVRATIEREWSALVSNQKEGRVRQCFDTPNPRAFPGRRRSFAGA